MKKRALTLLEIMIVIFLITLITGTIGYSMRGTMDKGRAFRTRQAQEQLHDLLLIALAEGNVTNEEIIKDPGQYLEKLGLAKDPEGLLLDGWNENFVITTIGKSDFNVRSNRLKDYDDKHGSRPAKNSGTSTPTAPKNEE